ncbi:unnamed protein product [Closterium sp. NIES-53]
MNDWSENGYWGALEARTQAALAVAQEWRDAANEALGKFEPLQLLVAALLAAVVAGKLAQVAGAVAAQIRYQGLVPTLTALFFSLIRLLPGVRAYVEEQQAKARAQIAGGSSSSKERAQWRKRLPDVGAEADEVLGEMRALRDKDKAWQGRCSGTVYVGGESYEKHMKLISDAYTMGGAKGREKGGMGREVCGNMTSGGSESILMAVKAARDYMRAKKGITRPEMIVPVSAHAAYDKAAEYFHVHLLRAPVADDWCVEVDAVQRLCSRNTVLIVASAPGFPHGIIDPIPVRTPFPNVFSYSHCCMHAPCLSTCLNVFSRPHPYACVDVSSSYSSHLFIFHSSLLPPPLPVLHPPPCPPCILPPARPASSSLPALHSRCILPHRPRHMDSRSLRPTHPPCLLHPTHPVPLAGAGRDSTALGHVSACGLLPASTPVTFCFSFPLSLLPFHWQELGEIALRWGTCLHVDCCLGGFVLPFAKKLGSGWAAVRSVGVPGVCAVLFSLFHPSPRLPSPSLPSSLLLSPPFPSSLLLSSPLLSLSSFRKVTWIIYIDVLKSSVCSLCLSVSLPFPLSGYMDITKRLMEASKAIVAGVSRIKGLQVVGEPDMTVIAMTSDQLDIYRVNDAMTHRGWALSALHKPASIHLCVTLQHVGVVDAFLADLQAAVDEVRSSPSPSSQGMAPIYGAGNRMPDRGAVKELLLDYMDSLT